jgi:hypothetical protein
MKERYVKQSLFVLLIMFSCTKPEIVDRYDDSETITESVWCTKLDVCYSCGPGYKGLHCGLGACLYNGTQIRVVKKTKYYFHYKDDLTERNNTTYEILQVGPCF